jgi:Cohesin domain
MPKKTLALISGLVVVTIVLFIIALRAGQQQQAPSIPKGTTMSHQPTPEVPAHTVLKLGPNPLTVAPGQVQKVNITMDTQDNNVTAVQLELGYDPHIIGSVKVTSGPMFTNPVVLINKNNTTTGRYTYAFGITPNAQAVKGSGVVATVSFIPLYGSTGKSMQLGLLPSSLVTARGVAQSVLKTTSGTVITVQSGAAMMHTTTGKQTSAPAMAH